MIGGIARLAGIAKKLYDNPAGRFAINAVPDFGFGVMMGQNPLVAGLGAVTGGIGQVAGEKALGGIAKAMGKSETTQRIAENIGGIPGYMVGSMGTYALAPALGLESPQQSEPMQEDPRQAQMQSDQQMMNQLTPEQIQKLQEQAARRAAQAQYQAQAMQQYGGYQ